MEVTLENINRLDGSDITAYYDNNKLSLDKIISKLRLLEHQKSGSNEGLLFDSFMCQLNFMIDDRLELPLCVTIKSKTYLVGDKVITEDCGSLYELFDMTTEMATNETESIYVSDYEIFDFANDDEREKVRKYLELKD